MATPDAPRANDAARPNRPDCFACAHLWITHEPARPYGCRAFGFVSRELPSAAVRASSGSECAAFEAKPPRPKA